MNGRWGRRLRSEWRLKLGLGSVFVIAFWALYWLLDHASAPARRMPSTRLDCALPLVPAAAWIYLSQYITTPLVLWLAPHRRSVWACCTGVCLLAGVSFAVYLVCPTEVDRPLAEAGRSVVYDWILQYDQPRNACPSLHAAFGVYLACCAGPLTRGLAGRRAWRAGLWCWTAAVLLSALLIRQHVVSDLVVGAAVGAASYGCIRRSLTRPSVEDRAAAPPLELEPAGKGNP